MCFLSNARKSPFQPCNYQISKSIVHVINFGDIAVMYKQFAILSDMYCNTDWQIEMFKEATLMVTSRDKCIFQVFSKICCWSTSEF